MSEKTLETALDWTAHGIGVIPILARDKAPALDDWSRYQRRLPTTRELEIWFARPGYGLAVIAGWNELCILDFDSTWQYSLWLAGLDEQSSNVVLATMRVTTRRGIHVYLYCSKVHNAKLPGCDVQAKNKYCLTPPTLHPSGVRYEAIGSIESIQRVSGLRVLLPNMPEEIVQPPDVAHRPGGDIFDEALQGESKSCDRYIRIALENESQRVASATDGWKHHQLLKSATALGELCHLGLTEGEIESALYSAVATRAANKRLAHKTITDGIKWGKAHPRKVD